MSESRKKDAEVMFNTLCATLDDMKWKYAKDEDKKTVGVSAVGEDLRIEMTFVVSEERQIMYVKSPMPFMVPENKRALLGEAVHRANYSMLNGSFEFDLSDGYIAFRLVVPFMDSIISREVCHYAIILTCQMVDQFNDKFLNLLNDKITMKQFCDLIEE